MGFQTQVNQFPAIAVNGDFATSNPRASVPAPESGFVAGSSGVVVGRFVWTTDGVTLNNTGTGKPLGFVHRKQQALITTYLGEASNTIPVGFPVTVMMRGDYFNTSTVAAASRGQKAFAKLADGTMQPANAGATVSGFIETDFSITRAAGIGELAVISQ